MTIKLYKPLVVAISITLRKTLVVTFMQPLPFMMSMSIHVPVKKIVTYPLLPIMGPIAMVPVQMQKAQGAIIARPVEIQIPVPQVVAARMEDRASWSQMAGLVNRSQAEGVQVQHLVFLSLGAIQPELIHYRGGNTARLDRYA
jgi:hypothetical protein